MLKNRRQDHVAILTIDRPERRNALGTALVAELGAELRRLDDDPDIGAIVLDAVPPGFCAGSDLKELGTMDIAAMRQHEAATAAMARSIGLLDTPVIVAVEGFALGGGFILAISGDIVVTASNCRWHLPEVMIGWIPPWGLNALTARTGPVAARRLVWGTESIDGTQAHDLGVADYVVAAGGASARAIELGARLVALPRPAVAATKRFFAPLAAGSGETGDTLANWMFAENCQHEVAKATLRKYGVRVG